MSSQYIEKRINVLKKIYVSIVVIFPFYASYELYNDARYLYKKEFLQNIINIVIATTIYFGLKKKNNWVVLLILFNSYMVLIYNFVTIVYNYKVPMEDIIAIKTTALLYMIFCIYQINLFSKKDTLAYFSEEGIILL